LLWLGFALGAVAGVLALAHAAPLVTALGGGGGEPALGASLAAIGNGVGRLLGGWSGERAAPLISVAALQALAMVGLLSALFAPGPEVALVALGLVGLGYGWMAGAYPVIVARFYGPAQAARVYGRLFTAWGTAALIAPVLGGALFDRAGNYRAALAIAAVATLTAAGALALLHRLRRPDHPRLD
jgi:OFA family oxalate/formate antiporter-like MFS transporter